MLIVDDDPTPALIFGRLAPDWIIHTADDGIAGLRAVRELRDRLRLVVLDQHMPHDGLLVAAQLRVECPRLPILPYSASGKEHEVFSLLGCMPALRKPASADQVRAAIADALTWTPTPAPSPALLHYLYDHALTLERAAVRRDSHSIRVAVLASSDVARIGLRMLAQAAGVDVIGDTTVRAVAQQIIHMTPALTLVTDDRRSDAEALGAAACIPVVYVALSNCAGYALAHHGKHVILATAPPAQFSAALRAIAAQGAYRDPTLDHLLPDALTPAERAVCVLALAGLEVPAIAATLHKTERTIYQQCERIYTRLGVRDLAGLRASIDAASATAPVCPARP
jgi:DNA-binding NarL/FixJ family response regulator